MHLKFTERGFNMLKFGIKLLFVTLIHFTVIEAWCGRVNEPSLAKPLLEITLGVELLISVIVIIVGIINLIQRRKIK